MRIPVLTLAATLLAAAPAAAQLRVLSLGAGTPVRVSPTRAEASRAWIEGRVIYADADSLVMRRRDTGEPATFVRGDIGALQLRLPRSRGHAAARYGLIGGGVGAAVGAAFGAASYREEEARGDFWQLDRGETALLTGLMAALPMAVAGAAVGLAQPSESWLSTGLPAAPTVSVRADGAVGIALRLRL